MLACAGGWLQELESPEPNWEGKSHGRESELPEDSGEIGMLPVGEFDCVDSVQPVETPPGRFDAAKADRESAFDSLPPVC